MRNPDYIGISGGMPATTFSALTGRMPARRLDKGDGVLVPVGQGKPPVGRNEPCVCGSNRKFKNCCLRTSRQV
jgi:hypothetical protein